MSSRPSRGAARLAAILDALPDALLLVNCNGTVVNANHIALESFETPGTALVGRGLLDLLPDFDSKRIPGSMRRPIDDREGGRTRPTRMMARRTDGFQFPVEVTSANLEDGRTPYADNHSYTGDELLMLVVRDLTGTVDTEAELARQQRQTEMILRAAAEGVVGVDTDGKVVLVNPSAAQILGFRASDLGGQELHPLVHHSRADGSPLPYEESPLADTLRSGRKHRVRNQTLWAKDGTKVPVDLTTAPVRDGDQLVGAVMTFTDRRQYEAMVARHTERYDAMVAEQTERYDAMVTEKTAAYDAMVAEKTTAYDAMLAEKTEAYDAMLAEQTERYDAMVAEQTERYDAMVTEKTAAYDAMLAEKTEAYDAMLAEQTERHDALAARHAQLLAVLDESLRGPLLQLRAELGTLAADPAGQLWPEANQILHYLAAGYTRMTTLVDNVLSFQRLDTGVERLERRRVSLDAVVTAAVEGAVELIGPGRAQFAVHAPPIEAEVDPVRLAQALAHLIADVAGVDSTGNAAGGGIPAGDSTIVVAAAQRGQAVRIEVRGPYPGGDAVHGPLVRGIVRLHGGVLQTHEVPGMGGGSAYVLDVPASAAAAGPAAAAPSGATAASGEQTNGAGGTAGTDATHGTHGADATHGADVTGRADATDGAGHTDGSGRTDGAVAATGSIPVPVEGGEPDQDAEPQAGADPAAAGAPKGRRARRAAPGDATAGRAQGQSQGQGQLPPATDGADATDGRAVGGTAGGALPTAAPVAGAGAPNGLVAVADATAVAPEELPRPTGRRRARRAPEPAPAAEPLPATAQGQARGDAPGVLAAGAATPDGSAAPAGLSGAPGDGHTPEQGVPALDGPAGLSPVGPAGVGPGGQRLVPAQGPAGEAVPSAPAPTGRRARRGAPAQESEAPAGARAAFALPPAAADAATPPQGPAGAEGPVPALSAAPVPGEAQQAPPGTGRRRARRALSESADQPGPGAPHAPEATGPQPQGAPADGAAPPAARAPFALPPAAADRAPASPPPGDLSPADPGPADLTPADLGPAGLVPAQGAPGAPGGNGPAGLPAVPGPQHAPDGHGLPGGSAPLPVPGAPAGADARAVPGARGVGGRPSDADGVNGVPATQRVPHGLPGSQDLAAARGMALAGPGAAARGRLDDGTAPGGAPHPRSPGVGTARGAAPDDAAGMPVPPQAGARGALPARDDDRHEPELDADAGAEVEASWSAGPHGAAPRTEEWGHAPGDAFAPAQHGAPQTVAGAGAPAAGRRAHRGGPATALPGGPGVPGAPDVPRAPGIPGAPGAVDASADWAEGSGHPQGPYAPEDSQDGAPRAVAVPGARRARVAQPPYGPGGMPVTDDDAAPDDGWADGPQAPGAPAVPGARGAQPPYGEGATAARDGWADGRRAAGPYGPGVGAPAVDEDPGTQGGWAGDAPAPGRRTRADEGPHGPGAAGLPAARRPDGGRGAGYPADDTTAGGPGAGLDAGLDADGSAPALPAAREAGDGAPYDPARPIAPGQPQAPGQEPTGRRRARRPLAEEPRQSAEPGPGTGLAMGPGPGGLGQGVPGGSGGAAQPGQDASHGRPISVRTLGQGVPFAPPGTDPQRQGPTPTGSVPVAGSGRRRKLASRPELDEQVGPMPAGRPGATPPHTPPHPQPHSQPRAQSPGGPQQGAQPQGAAGSALAGTPQQPHRPGAPVDATTGRGRTFAIGAPDEGEEGPQPLDGPNGAIEVVDDRTPQPPPDDELPPEPLDNPRRLLVWPAPDVSTQQALSDRGYRPVIVNSREEVDAQIAAYPAALFVDPLTGPITRTALQSLRTAAVAAEVPVLVTAGLGQATREAAYGADPAVLLKALAPRDSEQHPPRVLLIEEHEPIASALTATLERRGMQVARAVTDADAVALAGQMRPNLVVMDLMQVRRRRAGIVDWLRGNGLLNRTPLVVYTSADIDPGQLSRLSSGETVLFLAERSTSAEVQTRIVDLLAKIGTN
ncbi:PAS domain-containing protein [Streptomyces sp. LX-29]|uniref:PAS domain-containing protein n=1 Tax=Streptomyces sp. LX-29 TaxID=2900152 RepID=UPI00240D6693|nr:PAS domain-containing protein [Streptomyces sp. LX-29]WFB08354.1 PAS domain-containing protein [Streptomyces sp. LX-29]